MNQTEDKVTELKSYLSRFLEKLDAMNPDEASLDDVDQLLHIISKMEDKLK
ncbi:SE1561 family protein [Radiobacillus deserti]|uniref:SE1561 family protein n=1 Tax=Radiobacillus deserti TaxID=2594883 RepID=UPI00131587B9|nr:SE1561 family protein [Radiobacillus deserti]